LTGPLQDYLARQAEERAGATAVVMRSERLSYGELEARSNQLARVLLDVGCRRGDRVCLLTDKSPAAIVAMLATLKAGCAYVPLDLASPAARIARILSAADPSALLLAPGAIALLRELARAGVLATEVRIGALGRLPQDADRESLAFSPQHVAQASGEPLTPVSGGDDPAHILFTSGSTGDPKGVVITHANVRAFIEWAVPHFRTAEGERISGHPPLHFDLSTFDIYGSLRAGAELHLVPPDILLARGLADFISASQLTQWFSVPSTMTYMARFGAVPDQGFPSLERVLWCGEVLPTPVLVHWMRRVPQASFTNLYGPTEATIASSYYTVADIPPEDTGPIPIGAACAGEELLVLDEQLRPLPEEHVGELYIGGAGLSPGYWRDEKKTGDAFIADPRPGRERERLYRTGDLTRLGADGLLYFLGRVDSQVKSRGYRIELGEVEAALGSVPGVAECAVVGVPSDDFEGVAICCAFAPVPDSDTTAVTLRAALASMLPKYMIPSRWELMAGLPKNVNGKIDRRGLGEHFSSEAKVEVPS